MGLSACLGPPLQGCTSGGDSPSLRRPLPGHWVTDDEGHLWVGLRKDHGLGLWRGWGWQGQVAEGSGWQCRGEGRGEKGEAERACVAERRGLEAHGPQG